MLEIINSSWKLGSLTLPHRLIQGPLAGYSCAPMREMFSLFQPPAYCVSEMISAIDILNKHQPHSRYLFRGVNEKILCYQLSGNKPEIIAAAAKKLQDLGANLIDFNSGCPKTKIRKKGCGSALLENPQQLLAIVRAMRQAVSCPITVKIRLFGDNSALVNALADVGADAVIVHARGWQDDYTQACNWSELAKIKKQSPIPIIANGDIAHLESLSRVFAQTQCDAYMISRAGTGKPWLYQQLLSNTSINPGNKSLLELFMQHLFGLANLENDYKAVLQSKSLARYYFRHLLSADELQQFYAMNSLSKIKYFLREKLKIE